jgi:hypothetical protein
MISMEMYSWTWRLRSVRVAGGGGCGRWMEDERRRKFDADDSMVSKMMRLRDTLSFPFLTFIKGKGVRFILTYL